MTPTALYRLFDDNDRLLYVGIAGNVGRRLNEHAKTKQWALAIASVTVEHFASRSDALLAERRAIIDERPLHNIMGVVSFQPQLDIPVLDTGVTFRFLDSDIEDVTIDDPLSLWHVAKAMEMFCEDRSLAASIVNMCAAAIANQLPTEGVST